MESHTSSCTESHTVSCTKKAISHTVCCTDVIRLAVRAIQVAVQMPYACLYSAHGLLYRCHTISCTVQICIRDRDYFYPTDVLVTGYDIIFFWVIRMVFSGYAHTGKAPFNTVSVSYTHLDVYKRQM